MKKKYLNPVMDIYAVHPSTLLAGSLLAGDQSDPTMATELDTESLFAGDGSLFADDGLVNFSE